MSTGFPVAPAAAKHSSHHKAEKLSGKLTAVGPDFSWSARLGSRGCGELLQRCGGVQDREQRQNGQKLKYHTLDRHHDCAFLPRVRAHAL